MRSYIYTVSKVNRPMNCTRGVGQTDRQSIVQVSYRPAGFMLVAVETLNVPKGEFKGQLGEAVLDICHPGSENWQERDQACML